jgi:hypothetical protein
MEAGEMALTMTARLLCAARQAYMITVDGPVPAVPYLADIGYANPVGFASGALRIDAGLVGEAPDAIIVAFRGTLPLQSPDHAQVILDWANDCDALLVADPLGLKGGVHQGFRDALDSFWTRISATILTLADASPAKPIYVTGHSKGGPMANLAAGRLIKLRPNAAIYVNTFAGARAGDADFAAAYAAAVTNSDRYEFADDIVPHLPPMDALRLVARHLPLKGRLPEIAAKIASLTPGYVSVGDLHFINWSGTIVSESTFLEIERAASMMKVLGELEFDKIIADHSIDPPNPPNPDPPDPGYYSVLYR